jgi:hypothetical protein
MSVAQVLTVLVPIIIALVGGISFILSQINKIKIELLTQIGSINERLVRLELGISKLK